MTTEEPPHETEETRMNQAVAEQLGEASARLLQAIQDTAAAQYKLLQMREDREASPEQVSDAAHLYRRTEQEAQSALSDLLELHVTLLDSGVMDAEVKLDTSGPAEPVTVTPAEQWL